MPTNIRAGLSVLIAIATAVMFFIESGTGALHWIVLALGLFMIGAVWLFPEAKKSRDS